MSDYRVFLRVDENPEFIQEEVLILSFKGVCALLEEFNVADTNAIKEFFAQKQIEHKTGTLELLGYC